MSLISVTDAESSLALMSCSACARHAWMRDGVLLDREQMLAAMKQRIAEAPRPQGGRPRRNPEAPARRPRAPRAAAPVEDPAAAERLRRVQEMQAMLRGFEVHGS
jgi:hypothetical protein